MGLASSAPRRPGLLIVAYLFPPSGGIAVQRMLSLARYLPGLGVDVHVLSASNAAVPTIDESLVRLIPPEVHVTRAWSPEVPFALRQTIWRLAGRRPAAPPATPAVRSAPAQPSFLQSLTRRIFAPDPEVAWVPFALRAARRIVRQNQIDAVLVSAPPFSSFLVGNALKRQFPHLRLISDFRDEWLDFYLNAFDYYRHPIIKAKARSIEHTTVHASDLVLSITDSCVNTIRARYPGLPAGRFACLPNGFDPTAFESFSPRPHDGENLLVAHVGTVYPTSTPRFYLDALDALPPAERDSIETHFVGRITAEERPTLQNRAARLIEHGFVPQSDAIRFMEQADVLLLNMTDPNFASGKIYDYLATGKPILAISPPGGEVDTVITRTGAGWVLDPADPEALRRRLLALLDAKRSGAPLPQTDPTLRASFSRPALAARFNTILNDLLARP